MVKISLLRPVLASIELARKASMARRQGLKPAKRPAAKTVARKIWLRSLESIFRSACRRGDYRDLRAVAGQGRR